MHSAMNNASKIVPPFARGLKVHLALLLAAAALLIGCGPVQSTQRIGSAEVAMERARVNDAMDHSPYEYYRAVHYLHKSKMEWGYSNFEASRDYAVEARRSAEAALDNTREAPWRGHPVLGRNAHPDDIKALNEDDLDPFDDGLDN
jgi:hypothetical protein